MASYAAAIKREFEFDPETKTGKRGQFDVIVNGKTVVSRKGGLIAKLTKKPWPTEAEIIDAVKSELKSNARSQTDGSKPPTVGGDSDTV